MLMSEQEPTGEACQRCGEVGLDRRTLQMACFYDMDEMGLPFTKQQPVTGSPYYTLRVCKACRGSWMAAITDWFNARVVDTEPPGGGIFVRKLGATVEITEDEWNRDNPGREPVRVRDDAKNSR